jgi:putative DNA primase/helicase
MQTQKAADSGTGAEIGGPKQQDQFTIVGAFKQEIIDAGLPAPDDLAADGQLHRFSTSDRGDDKAGWYVLHADGIGAGAFGCWRSGIKQEWCSKDSREFSEADRREYAARMKAIAAARKAEEAARHKAAATKAAAVWDEAKPAPADHSYLAKKRVKPHGIRVTADGRLVVPVLAADGALSSLQFIAGDGGKMFLSGGCMSGGFFLIGGGDMTRIVLAEGYATAATIHESTGLPVFVGFNASNLPKVAQAIRSKHRDADLIIAADDDIKTVGNPGLKAAHEAAKVAGGRVVVPAFGADRPEKATDFNDMATTRGIESVRELFSALSFCHGTNGTDGTQASDAELQRSVTKNPDGTDGTTASDEGLPALRVETFPSYHILEEKTYVMPIGCACRSGVWLFGMTSPKPTKNGEAGEPTPTADRICSPIHIEAVTSDEREQNFGRLLRFRNTFKHWRKWAMPMELLGGQGDELRKPLLSMGVDIEPKAKHLLSQYLQAGIPPKKMLAASQTGWCKDSFVLPGEVIGPDAGKVIFQSGEADHDEYQTAGTFAGWRSGVSLMAIGNPMLTMALSGSFAGPLMALCNAESGGLHLHGDSASGKTTAAEAACSVWGGPGYKRSWRATANGMEGAAAMFNDCLLALDEISECDPREVGAIVYALANGRGKQRASRSGAARGVTRWRCFALSNGERTIETVMREAGCRPKAGQAVRLVDIPVARRYGAWDNLHGFASGAMLSEAIKTESAKHYGHAGKAFLQKLTCDRQDLPGLLEIIKTLPCFAATDGQEKRVAGRFALIALAGELATEYGITGWVEGDAIESAALGFSLWRSGRGGAGNDEGRQIADAVTAFLDRHGDSRFSAMGDQSAMVRDRAGWWTDQDEGRCYLFTGEGLRDALKGFDFQRALTALQEAGALPPGRERAKQCRIDKSRVAKLYSVMSWKLGGGDHES